MSKGNVKSFFGKISAWFGRMSARYGKQRVILCVLLVISVPLLGFMEADPEIENYTRYTDYEPQKADPTGLIPGENHHVLVAWFSRVGNTVFDPDVDVITRAIMVINSRFI